MVQLSTLFTPTGAETSATLLQTEPAGTHLTIVPNQNNPQLCQLIFPFPKLKEPVANVEVTGNLVLLPQSGALRKEPVASVEITGNLLLSPQWGGTNNIRNLISFIALHGGLQSLCL